VIRPCWSRHFDSLIPSPIHRARLRRAGRHQLGGPGSDLDLVVVTTVATERYRDHPGMVIHTAVEEGREVYAA